MSNKLNPTSKRIITSWFERAQIPVKEPKYDYFDRFITLWISFNCYFVSGLHDKACNRISIQNKNETIKCKRFEPSEADYLKVLIDTPKYKCIYLNLIENSDDFVNKLELFKEFIQRNDYKGMVADLRSERRKKSHAKKFSNINNFKQFIFVTYQIRCNLFHGNKSPFIGRDTELVKLIFDPFNEFLTEIYKEERYLSNYI